MLLLLSCVVFFATATATATAASDTSSSSSSSSFIREKYLDELYNQQYCYTLEEIQYNPEICPEFHSSAMYFAITGQRQLNRVSQTCRHIQSPLQPRDNTSNSYVLLSDIILTDIVFFFKEFVCYTFEYGMLLISVILASCSTLFMIMLLFCQY